MKARVVLHLNSAFDGAVAASKAAVVSLPVRDIRISSADTPSTDDNISRNGSQNATPDTQNPTVTPSHCPGAAREGNHAVFELEKV